jgi:hypothetical protein
VSSEEERLRSRLVRAVSRYEVLAASKTNEISQIAVVYGIDDRSRHLGLLGMTGSCCGAGKCDRLVAMIVMGAANPAI